MAWQGVVFHTPQRACFLCDLLLRAGRQNEASQVLDDVDALVFDTDEACYRRNVFAFVAKSPRGRGDLTGATSCSKPQLLLPVGSKRDYSSFALQHN